MPPVLNEYIPNLLSLSYPLLNAHSKTCDSSLILLQLQEIWVWNGVVGIETTLGVGKLRNRGLILDVDRGFLSFLQSSDRIWGPQNLRLKGYPGMISPGLKRSGREAYHLFLFSKTNSCTEIQIYFGHTHLHVSGSLHAHHQELSTVQSTPVYFMQVWPPLILQAWGRQTCIKCTSVDCTVDNSWWWVWRLPETCRVVWPK
jgi:hypothetical protein